MQKITPFFWYSKEAEQAAEFYASIFPDSRVTRVVTMPSDSPSGPAGSVKVVDFVLAGQNFSAMTAGPHDPFNHAVSFVVNCEDQAEVDRYWNALLQGGKPEQCGWLKDRFGVSWQIVPTILIDMMSDPDRAKAKRAADAMMKMVKSRHRDAEGGVRRLIARRLSVPHAAELQCDRPLRPAHRCARRRTRPAGTRCTRQGFRLDPGHEAAGPGREQQHHGAADHAVPEYVPEQSRERFEVAGVVLPRELAGNVVAQCHG